MSRKGFEHAPNSAWRYSAATAAPQTATNDTHSAHSSHFDNSFLPEPRATLTILFRLNSFKSNSFYAFLIAWSSANTRIDFCAVNTFIKTSAYVSFKSRKRKSSD
jgi:hypothetical protein